MRRHLALADFSPRVSLQIYPDFRTSYGAQQPRLEIPSQPPLQTWAQLARLRQPSSKVTSKAIKKGGKGERGQLSTKARPARVHLPPKALLWSTIRQPHGQSCTPLRCAGRYVGRAGSYGAVLRCAVSCKRLCGAFLAADKQQGE